MVLYLTGDTHGTHDVHKLSSSNFPEGKTLTRNDYVVILGDFGFLWRPYPTPDETYWLKWLNEKPWTTLVVDGNHENHERIDVLPSVAKFKSVVGQIGEHIFHLRRGRIYTINKQTFFVMGGGYSIDKSQRVEGVSWWAREIPSYHEFDRGLARLEQCNNHVDFVLGHTGPESIVDECLKCEGVDLVDRAMKFNDPVAAYFEVIKSRVDYRAMFFGHLHPSKLFQSADQKHFCLYNTVIQLEDLIKKIKEKPHDSI